MTEYRTQPLSRNLLLEELQFVCNKVRKYEISAVAVSFGWDSNLEIEEMWKKQTMPAEEVMAFLNAAEQAGTVEVGKADIFIDATDLTFQLCHESDVHVKGKSLLVCELISRWKAAGYATHEVEVPSGPDQHQGA